MKPNTAIPMPRQIAALPRHKDLPVPAMVQFDVHGVPDFKVIDMEKWGVLMHTRGCGICGMKMGARVWFVGGPLSIENQIFTDLPMHEDCAKYALRVCPYLALQRYRFVMSDVHLDGVTLNVNEHVSTQRPDRFGLACTRGYRLVVFRDSGFPALQAEPFSIVEWWHHGIRVT